MFKRPFPQQKIFSFPQANVYLELCKIEVMGKSCFSYFLLLNIFFIVPDASFCQTSVIEFKDYTIDKQIKVDSSFITMLSPYADSIKHSMNTVIGFSITGLTKHQPESTLGNFMADAMKIMAEKKFNKKIAASFVNYGGIRSYIPKGDITVGTVYELMPFDNLIVLQEISGKILQQLLDKTAASGGWPVAGITLTIKGKKAVNVLIDDKPIDENAKYVIANSDYVANGGDDCSMLKGIPVQNINYLYRDALIEYILFITKQGKPISVKTENRVVYAN